MLALGTLAHRLEDAADLDAVVEELAKTLGQVHLAIPLALLYVVDAEDSHIHLAEELGKLAPTLQAPLVLPMGAHNGSTLGSLVSDAALDAKEHTLDSPDYHALILAAGGAPSTPADLVMVLGNGHDELDGEAFWSFARALAKIVASTLKQQQLAHNQRTIGQLRREAETNEHLYKNAAAAASKSRDEFLMTLSHELRTPLQAILGWSHLLATRRLEGELFWHAVRSIERNTRWQAQLIEDLLDMSQAVTGRLRLNLQSTELDPVIESAVDAVRAAAELKGVNIELTLTSGPVLWCDPDRLQQVVWNLLANAVKFTPRGGTVRIQESYSPGIARLEVRDDGEGIPEELLPNIFNRFSQAEGVDTRTHSGIGLGLAIVRHIIELHGGTIAAYSSGKQKGSLFVIELPMSPEDRHRLQMQKRADEKTDEQADGVPA